MPKHYTYPVTGKDFIVNGVKYRCVAVSNQPRTDLAEISARTGDSNGTYVHLRRIKKNGQLTLSTAVVFNNCANEPSWYEQDVSIEQ